MGFKENLKAELNFQNMLVKELAAKTGISKRTIDNYLREKSNDPPASTAVKIAQALGVSVEYLVTGKTSEENSFANKSGMSDIASKSQALPPNERRIVIDLINSLKRNLK